MKREGYLYGLLGLLSFLGFIGVFTDERLFLAFFAFAVDFEYFFVRSDEMVEAYMNRSAARAFCLGMAAVAVAALVQVIAMGVPAREALMNAFAAGWAVSVVVHALSTACYGFREKWGLRDD